MCAAPTSVAFLDLDQELLAPRYRAAEQAMALLARAARLVGGRGAAGGRLLLQTRLPDHEVIDAVVHADPSRLDRAGARPPGRAAVPSRHGDGHRLRRGGRRLRRRVARPAGEDAARGLEILGPADGRWLVRAPDHQRLCDALAAVPRPPGRLRVNVDPSR